MVILGSVEETVGETVGGPTARFKSDSEQKHDIFFAVDVLAIDLLNADPDTQAKHLNKIGYLAHAKTGITIQLADGWAIKVETSTISLDQENRQPNNTKAFQDKNVETAASTLNTSSKKV